MANPGIQTGAPIFFTTIFLHALEGPGGGMLFRIFLKSKASNDASPSKQNICITFVQFWTNVEDVGPTLYKCYTNVFCLLGFGSFFVFVILNKDNCLGDI